MDLKKEFSKMDIEKILSEHDFKYQRVNLPFGLHTPGQDRSGTLEVIFPPSLRGKSVLDVGSAIGYFCFEAEKRGASRVLGIEPNIERFNQANILKEILSSNVEFINQDVVEYRFNEQFDYVLILNVIHHLKDPISVMRCLARITLEKMIIEFPTFSDPKYRKHTSLRFSSYYNKFPLIAVSNLEKFTFLFTPTAIQRLLLAHEKFFNNVKFINSPMNKGRVIAIFCKKNN